MNNAQLDPRISATPERPNLSIDPGAVLQLQQQPFLEIDTFSSRAASSPIVPRLSTPDSDDNGDDELEKEDKTPRKPNTRSIDKMPIVSSKFKSTSTTATESKGGGCATGTADKRRKRNLERNRAAASKCRRRKKQWQDGLERKKTELESRYKTLRIESKELMEEVVQLKNFVMAHAACNDVNIGDWIRNEADTFVRRMKTTEGQGNAVANATTGPSGTTAEGKMVQMHSTTQVNLTATPPMNGKIHIQDWELA